MTKPKVPKGYPCDASIGWHSDNSGAPVIDMCPNLATVAVRGMWGFNYLCETCHYTFLKRLIPPRDDEDEIYYNAQAEQDI